MRILLFTDVRKAIKFLRRHAASVVQVIVVVSEGASASWKGAVKTNYGAVVLQGLVILQES